MNTGELGTLQKYIDQKNEITIFENVSTMNVRFVFFLKAIWPHKKAQH